MIERLEARRLLDAATDDEFFIGAGWNTGSGGGDVPPRPSDFRAQHGPIVGTAKNDKIHLFRFTEDFIGISVNGNVTTAAVGNTVPIRIFANGGNDRILIDSDVLLSSTTIYGGGGNDTIFCGNARDRVFAGEGNDLVTGGDGRDTIYGEGGDDSVRGGGGSDYMEGGDGADTLRGDAGNDRIGGGANPDRIRGSSGNDSIEGGGGRDRCAGEAGDDSVDGGAGEDVVDGGSGADVLRGGSGRDNIAFSEDEHDNCDLAEVSAGESINCAVTLSSGTLLKTGTGTLTLTAANTFTGSTTVNAGTLNIASGAALNGTSGKINVSGGTLKLSTNNLQASSATILVSSGAVMELTGTTANETVGSLELASGGYLSFKVGPDGNAGALHVTKSLKSDGGVIKIVPQSPGPSSGDYTLIDFPAGSGESAPDFTLAAVKDALHTYSLRVDAPGGKVVLRVGHV